jgi:hypothetical protein
MREIYIKALIMFATLITILALSFTLFLATEAQSKPRGGSTDRVTAPARVAPVPPSHVYKAPSVPSTTKPHSTKPASSGAGFLGGMGLGYIFGQEPEDCDMGDWLNNEPECEGVDFHEIDEE